MDLLKARFEIIGGLGSDFLKLMVIRFNYV
jgi:hypothetical protein